MKIESQPSELPRKLFLAVAVPVIIVAAVLAAYQPSFDGDWLWDDDTSVWNNPVVTQPDGLRRIWLTRDTKAKFCLGKVTHYSEL